ncbi:cysteine desulfurase family protein [uncultured Tenacibaculum sp.]|uniref:cysteine desulfurase family protein n=1 Tax=uncultured Tenacibaculum sp. TaxID=174713 RepID=UPI0026103583|nr:cysteine desulfurase family protein [uncultured Tenacibaculum sp.]
MKRIYLDNAATTPMLPEVIELMSDSMRVNFGNPSSTHQFGRTAKVSVETARKNIAKHFNVSAREIIFTSGGTEADNLILQNAVANLGVETIVTTRIEHHAVLHTIEFLESKYGVNVVYLKVNDDGGIDLDELASVLESVDTKALVSLMWVNNEIGNLLPIKEVAKLCKINGVLFHSDTVQGIGHYELDLKEVPIDFITASAHKFHGPKGVGFAYVKKNIGIFPMFHGGDQERGSRSSTENVHSILGMEKGLDIAMKRIEKDTIYIKGIKKQLIDGLIKIFPEIHFNGLSSNMDKSTYTVLNVRFPFTDKLLLFNLDLFGISVSGGSACQSGSDKGSHVLDGFLNKYEAEKTSVRFSFSRFTKKEDIVSVLSFFEVLKK